MQPTKQVHADNRINKWYYKLNNKKLNPSLAMNFAPRSFRQLACPYSFGERLVRAHNYI
jgi:hypothetical protein